MTDLPRSTPAEQGVDARGIDRFLAAVAPRPHIELHSLMVLRHGQVVAERWWQPYQADTPCLVYSLSKSFASTALGFAVAEGLVDLDAPVLSYFPEWDERVTDPRSRQTTVRAVASMASGHRDETIERAIPAGAGDMTLGLLLLPPEREPGSVFAYNQPCSNAIAAIVERVGGGALTEFLRPRLFEPLGIKRYGWSTDPVGRQQGFSGLHVTTETIAKLGQFLLDGGRWQGEQLLPAAWVAEAARPHVATGPDDSDWGRGYGFQFWRSRHGYRGDGAFGQFMLILPEADAVVAITSQSHDMQGILDAVWKHLRPALTAGAGPAGAWPQESPELAAPAGQPGAAPPEATYLPGAANTVEPLRAVRVGAGELVLDDGTTVTAPLGGPAGWTVADAMATACRRDGDRFRADVIFLETPHRMHLVLDPATESFEAAWQTEPLGFMQLAQLRCPQ
jgi:CubicO group peptidase (beta-lactamase class C family)